MPAVTGPQTFNNQFPSFMSIYSRNAHIDQDNQHGLGPAAQVASTFDNNLRQHSQETSIPPLSQSKHRDSTSTNTSTSTESSPTTTISTADSSALTDPSPSSSPESVESPVTILPLSSFATTGFGIHSLDDLTMPKGSIVETYDRPLTSPTLKKPRNAKGLALNLGAQDQAMQASAPASPATFVKPPIPKPRKKPSVLSLQTTSNFGNLPLAGFHSDPPPTPSVRLTAINRNVSTPGLALFSPDPRAAGPPGGMRLPSLGQTAQLPGLSTTFRQPSGGFAPTYPEAPNKIDEEVSPIRTQMANRGCAEIGGDSFDHPGNEDDKSPGYPDGPIAIYEPGVFLYSEPTAEEAAQFDVIMNVASEVKNPFMDVAPLNTVVVHARDTDAMDIDRDDIPEPQTAATMATFKTAFEVQPTSAASSGSPTTPKATQKQPEYIHVQWEHNTDITKDLMGLCDTIDDRARKGKKVLVHCQQGASRSASLIIAYGMYRNPSLTVDAAYNAAQAKSKWISPNINLMYALQDFRKALQARAATKHGRSPAKHKMALSVDDIDFAQKEPPQTAPLPSENTPSRMSPVGTPPHMRGNSTPNLREITVGPASAPMTFAYTPDKVQLPDFSNWPALSPPQQYSFENSEHQLTPPVPTPPASIERNQPVRAEPVVPMLISHPVPVDTPHQSLPTTSPSATGFFAHREGQGTKRKPKPIPTLDLRQGESSQTLPGLSGLNQTSDIRPQFATRPVAVPETPGLWSPRVAEMAAPLVSKTLLHDAAPTAPAKDESLPPPESVFSPTVTDFGINPFGQMLDVQPPPALTAVPIGQVLRKQKSAIFEKGKLDLQKPLPPLPTVDPRSPAMNGEAGIIRSIDEML